MFNFFKRIFKKKEYKSIFACEKCGKDMTAGPFPKWVCLQKECENYHKRVEI